MAEADTKILMRLKKTIEERAFVSAKDTPIVSKGGAMRKKEGWIFDIRKIILDPDILKDIASLFWTSCKTPGPLQIGGIESASLPLITTFVLSAREYGREGVSGFFIRKSRKKDGLMKMVEGDIRENGKIILVDDILNSGKSFIRQIEVLESLGKKVDSIWTLIRFRDERFYTYFSEKGIAVQSLFTLDDFTDALGVENLLTKEPPAPRKTFRVVWKFAAKNGSYFHVVPKSGPVIDAEKIYMGTDGGVFFALNQSDGSTAWSYKVGAHAGGKGIFSSPTLFENTVFFGAYDGNVYALDTNTGKARWIFYEADWVGSSPAIAPDLGLIFIGTEFGLWKKRGGIVALDARTGKKKWQYEMPCFTHSTPLFIEGKQQVIIGSNDGAAYLFNAKNGTLVWKFETAQLTDAELSSGFSDHDIKESFAYDSVRDLVMFGTMDGSFFVLERKTGHVAFHFKADFGIYSTPLLYHDTVCVASLDKNLYCFDLNTFEEQWRWNAGARIFATPTVIGESLYIGANTGRLTELDPETGHERSFFPVTERITNKVAYNAATGRIFVPTFANELYCIERNS